MRRQEYAMAVQAIRSRAFYSHTLTYSSPVHALELHYALSGRRRCRPPGLQPGQWVNTYSPIVHDFQAFQQNLQHCISIGRSSSPFINLKAFCVDCAPFNHILEPRPRGKYKNSSTTKDGHFNWEGFYYYWIWMKIFRIKDCMYFKSRICHFCTITIKAGKKSWLVFQTLTVSKTDGLTPNFFH